MFLMLNPSPVLDALVIRTRCGFDGSNPLGTAIAAFRASRIL
jgi:hypothetical protein